MMAMLITSSPVACNRNGCNYKLYCIEHHPFLWVGVKSHQMHRHVFGSKTLLEAAQQMEKLLTPRGSCSQLLFSSSRTQRASAMTILRSAFQNLLNYIWRARNCMISTNVKLPDARND